MTQKPKVEPKIPNRSRALQLLEEKLRERDRLAGGKKQWSDVAAPEFSKSVAFKMRADVHRAVKQEVLNRSATPQSTTLAGLLEEIVEAWFTAKGRK